MSDQNNNENSDLLKKISSYHQWQDSVVAMNIQGQIISWNPGAERLLGYSASEILGKHISSICSEESYLQLKKTLLTKFSKQKSFETELSLKDSSGSCFSTRINISVLTNSNGEALGFIAYSIDYKKQQHLVDLFKESENLFRTTLSAMEDWVFVFDKDKRFTFYHSSPGDKLFVSSIEHIGKMHSQVMPEHVDKKFQRAFLRCKKSNKSTQYDFDMKIGDGFRSYSAKMSPVVSNDEFEGVVCVIRDMTDSYSFAEQVRTSEIKYQDLFNNSLDGIVFTDLDGKVLEANRSYQRMLGYSLEELKQMTFSDFTPQKYWNFEMNVVLEQLKERGFAEEYEKEYIHKNGTVFPVSIQGLALYDDEKNIVGYWGYVRNITARRSIEGYLSKLSAAVEQSPTSIMITNTEGVVEYVNTRYLEVMGEGVRDIVGKMAPIFDPLAYPEIDVRMIWESLFKGFEWRSEVKTAKKDGGFIWEYITISPIKTDGFTSDYFLISKEDLTRHKEYEQLLTHKSNYDLLTDLPNRFLAFDRLAQMVSVARRGEQSLAVLFVDLDQFKIINDTLGHEAGDIVLIEAAKRLKTCVRVSDTVARFGGDEFLIILPDYNPHEHEMAVAKKILEVFSKPFRLSDRDVFLTASIGITVFPDDGNEANILLSNADAAAYKAKDESRNTFCFFTNEMNKKAVERLEIEHDLRMAVENDELELYYQPVIDVTNREIAGVEALLRWFKIDGTQVPVDYFVNIAEQTGLIIPIGDWVLDVGCSKIMQWRQEYGQLLKLALNVAPNQFRTGRFAHDVERILKLTGLPPEHLELEITERMLMENDGDVVGYISDLKSLGVKLALDDFGTGYSSLAYLRKFAFDIIKIDRSFVKDIGVDENDEAIVQAIVSMAKSLGLSIIAEGVETRNQYDFLEYLGCDYIQGYYFSRPLNDKTFAEYLIKSKSSK